MNLLLFTTSNDCQTAFTYKSIYKFI